MNIGKVYDIQKERQSTPDISESFVYLSRERGSRRRGNDLQSSWRVLHEKIRKEARGVGIPHAGIAHLSRDRRSGARSHHPATPGRFLFFQELENDARSRERFEKPLAFYLDARQKFRELQLAAKGELPKLVIGELQSRLGAEQLTACITEIEPRTRQIVEQTLRN